MKNLVYLFRNSQSMGSCSSDASSPQMRTEASLTVHGTPAGQASLEFSFKGSPGSFAGLIVDDVVRTGPAYNAGLKPDDRVTAVNGTVLLSVKDYFKCMQFVRPDDMVQLTVVRSGVTLPLILSIVATSHPITSPSIMLSPLNKPAVGRWKNPHIEPGMLVYGVRDDRPGASAGLRSGDRVLSVNAYTTNSLNEYKHAMDRCASSSRARFLVSRQGQVITMDIQFHVHADGESKRADSMLNTNGVHTTTTSNVEMETVVENVDWV